MGYFRFFFNTLQTFYRPVPYPMRKKIYKIILQITIYEKSKNFTVTVSQMRVLGQKNYRGGGAKRPPSLYRVKLLSFAQQKLLKQYLLIC